MHALSNPHTLSRADRPCPQTSMLAATPTGGYTLDYETNVAMNAEYMVEFGTVGETPDTLRISISDYMAGNFYTGGIGEWLRIAIPYPSNANFSVAYGSAYPRCHSVSPLSLECRPRSLYVAKRPPQAVSCRPARPARL